MQISFGFKNRAPLTDLQRKLEQYARDFPEVNKRAVNRLINEMRNELIGAVREKQSRYAAGYLMRSIRAQVVAEGQRVIRASVGTPVEYARYLEEGTKRHFVGPVRKKCLAWRSQTGFAAGRKWLGKAFSAASKSGKWSGWGHSKGHYVSGIKAWGIFAAVEQWASKRADEIYDEEIKRLK
jgi:IS4 transposase